MLQKILSGVADYIFLFFVVGIPAFAAYKKVDVFSTFITGAKSAFEMVVNLLPYIIAMTVAVGMLRASGFFDMLANSLQPVLQYFGFPKDLLPLAIVRPFSGSAALGVFADIAKKFGGDSFIAQTAATMMGSTETTFYVVALYFGSVAIKRTRYAIVAGLSADLAGFIASVWICKVVFF
jgi:spore maturation protein B